MQGLYLYNNAIGEVGVYYLAEAIKFNQVNNYLFLIFVQFLVKVLTTVSLSENQIGRSGVKYLSEALQHNSVTIHSTKKCCI